MPKRLKIPYGMYKGKFLQARIPGEKIYCERCGKIAYTKFPGQPWLCRHCAIVGPEGQAALERIRKKIIGRNPKKVYRTVARFPSKSRPGTYYTVKVDEEGHLSCNCPRWVFVKGAIRDCPHIRIVMTERNPQSLYEAFHGAQPRMRKVKYEPPKKGEPLVKIGRLVRIEYEPEYPSKRQGTRFYHDMGTTLTEELKSNAILATDVKGKNLYILKDKDTKYPVFTERGIIG